MKIPNIVLFLSVLLVSLPVAGSADPAKLSEGQTFFVPAYSHIYHGNKETPLLLSVTLSIRNTDRDTPITITEVNYHGTDGTLLRQYLQEPMTLLPLAATRFVVPQRDTTGGSGANFIVNWKSEKVVNSPIMETVMIGTQSQLGISFTSRGKPIHD